MTRMVIGWIVGAVAATSIVSQEKAADISMTGCVAQGSSASVFILAGAKLKSDDQNEKAKTYVLVNQVEDLDLKGHINHEVTVTGVAEAKTPPVPPAGQKVNEKDLPRFTAKAFVMVADRCTTGAR